MTEPADRKQRVRAAFNRAAPSYNSAAAVQREICQQLLALARAHPPRAPVSTLVDAGCGTGVGAGALLDWLQPTQHLAIDFAAAMLRQPGHPARARLLCADLEALPIGDAQVDALWSSLALQWCNPATALHEIGRVLRPGGRAWIATLGPDTLHELRGAFAGIDHARHVIDFHPATHWHQCASDAGLRVRATRHPPTAATATTLKGLLRDIKAIGADQVGDGRRRAPLGRQAWQTLQTRYEKHRRADGLLPATYDVILLALEKPA